MRLLIDIPEDAYRQIRNWGVPTDELRRKIYDIIDNGTPLPKGHGDLIDRKELLKDVYKRNYTDLTYRDFVALTDYAPTIIEAEGSEQNEK